MIRYRERDEVFFKEIDRSDSKKQPPARKGVIARLHDGSEQMGVRYDQGGTKVWVCLEDVEILRLT
jgi:hypothetical protein